MTSNTVLEATHSTEVGLPQRFALPPQPIAKHGLTLSAPSEIQTVTDSVG